MTLENGDAEVTMRVSEIHELVKKMVTESTTNITHIACATALEAFADGLDVAEVKAGSAEARRGAQQALATASAEARRLASVLRKVAH